MNKLKEACIISHQHWLNDLEQTLASIDIAIPEIKVPKKAKEKIAPITKKNSKISKKVIKVLIIAAIIMALFMTVSAFTPFKDFIVEYFEDYNLFTSNVAKTNHPKKFELKYVPEDFVLVKEELDSLGIFQEYSNNNKSFAVTKNSPTADFQISNTYTEEVVFYNEDVKYTFMQLEETVNIVVWLTEDYSYSITGYNMTKEEMIEIAKGIK